MERLERAEWAWRMFELAEGRGWSLSEYGSRMEPEVTAQTMWSWKEGRRVPTRATLDRMARALGFRLERVALGHRWALVVEEGQGSTEDVGG